MRSPIKVLIIDDSALVRQLVSSGLEKDSSIEVVGTASNVYEGRDKIVYLKPDVVTLDIEMPKMDGITFLKKLMPQYPLPVIILSSLTQKNSQLTYDALEYGAIDVVLKPSKHRGVSLNEIMLDLIEKVKAACTADVSHWAQKKGIQQPIKKVEYLSQTTDKVIAIGASTGGTVALKHLINDFPPDFPGTVVVQHMPPGFTRIFSDKLNLTAKVEVKEAEDGDRIRRGIALIAPGGKQMEVIRSGGQYRVHIYDSEKVSGHCPSVDVLFSSMAKVVGPNGYGIILTGMGSDGANGMKAMAVEGAYNIAQDEATSVVYGMPKAAFELGAVKKVVPLGNILRELTLRLNGSL
ncbi:protein-glutamate methylesterase/protein-glutamine glutaminase [Spirochaeta cellobiosiphila]|uniref:protein-glutamate methylesterase/protein-glutamine glutaminase n=1 Tax=Spirochaeta cellobiosiphila TaxID=504483 RepID=UPI00041257E0|nr:chemotaxis response regulator protein-glutamate methylesterase [Spirochaeta cellobiosiphila]